MRAGDGVRIIQPQRGCQVRGGGPEGGQTGLAIGDDGHTEGFQHFKRLGQVEDGFGPGADHRDGGLRQFLKVGGDVEAEFGAAMHAADAARGEGGDAGGMGGDHGGGDRRGAGAAGGDAEREVGAAELGDGLRAGEGVELALVEADMQLALEHGDGGRGGAGVAHRLLDLAGGLQVPGRGHTVGDDGAFERHDGARLGAGGGDLGRELQGQGGHGAISLETWVAAA